MRPIVAITWLLYILLAAWTTFHHEPWRDEAQAWLIARDLPPSSILAQMRYEGSPALWHLLLHPLAAAGAPYATEAVIHLAIAAGAVGLLLWRAPFPLWFKALLVFSPCFSYEYAVVARNYGLTALLLFGIAATWRARHGNPFIPALLVALLANTNAHSLAMAAALAAWLAFDLRGAGLPRRRLGAVLLAASGVAAAVAQMGTGDRNHLIGTGIHVHALAPIVALRSAWLPGLPAVAAAPAIVLTTVLMAVLWRWSRAVAWVLLTALCGISAIFVFKHAGGLRHHGLMLVFMVTALWLAWTDLAAAPARWRRHLLVAMGLALATGLPLTARLHAADTHGLYSGSRQLAAEMRAAGLTDRFLAAYPSAPAAAVLPYLPGKSAWYVDIEASGTFVTWNRRFAANQQLDAAEVVRRVRGAPGWGRGALLLLNERLAMPSDHGLAPLVSVDEAVFTDFGEKFHLYECMGADLAAPATSSYR